MSILAIYFIIGYLIGIQNCSAYLFPREIFYEMFNVQCFIQRLLIEALQCAMSVSSERLNLIHLNCQIIWIRSIKNDVKVLQNLEIAKKTQRETTHLIWMDSISNGMSQKAHQKPKSKTNQTDYNNFYNFRNRLIPFQSTEIGKKVRCAEKKMWQVRMSRVPTLRGERNKIDHQIASIDINYLCLLLNTSIDITHIMSSI